jgi:hypothetical protein
MNKSIISLTILATLFFVPVVVFAAPKDFPELIGLFISLINSAVSVVFALAVLGFFWGVSKFIFSAGDTSKIEEGRKIMMWGIIALFVMVSIWGILAILENTFLDAGPTDYEYEAYNTS